MSLVVTVSYEPDGSPSLRDRSFEMKVSRLQTALDITREVYERVKGELQKPFEDYLLFWPRQKVWLTPEKQIGHFHLESGAKLQFKTKRRPLRIRFLDATCKILHVDCSLMVREVLSDVCSQLRLQYPEEMSLVVAGDYAVTKHHPAKSTAKRVESASPSLTRRALGKTKSTVPRESDISPPLSPSTRRKRPLSGTFTNASKRWTTSRVRKQISKKHQIRLDTPWLDPSKTLAEQEVTESNELILMYRFYYHMTLDRYSANLELLYTQARATYLAGEMLCTVSDMVRLSAILTQITKGDYISEKYNSDLLMQIKTQIAPPKCKVKNLAKQILAEHATLKGLSVRDAKCWFVKLWSSLELFGMEFLSCTNTDTKENGLIGVSKDRIVFLPHKKKKNFCWDIETLVQWKQESGKDLVTLSFSHDGSTHPLTLHLPEYSGVLADCLQGHRELSDTVIDMSRGFHEFQFDEDLESAISGFTAEVRKDPKERTFKNLTYEDVYWASKIENPLFSGEELEELRGGTWENPTFDNMDQLMDERFSFLDFTEYNSSETTLDSGISSGQSLEPHSPPSRRKSDSLLGGQSPLVRSTHSMGSSPREPRNPRHDYSPRPRLTNGLLDTYNKTHSREGSSTSSDSLPSPRPSEETLLPVITSPQNA